MPRLPWQRTDPHTLAGAYALDALGRPDRARFERHLSGCPACRQEARGLREATSWLAATAVTRPPDGLRERVLGAAAQTRQNQPVASPRRDTWPARRWGMAIGCGVLAIALAFGGIAFNAQHQLSQEQARSRAISAVLNAPDATMLTATATSGGTGTVVMSHRARSLVLTVARLPSLPGAQRYEVWLMGQSGARPAGMLPAPRSGMTPPMIVTGLRAGDQVVVTVEPASGAARPTTPMILVFSLPS
jgi:Anti-sigma-K factor rskA/Putative zinc-finger